MGRATRAGEQKPRLKDADTKHLNQWFGPPWSGGNFLVSPNCPGKARLCRCKSAGKYFENLARKIWIKHVRMFILWMNTISSMPTHQNISYLQWLRWVVCVSGCPQCIFTVVAGGILTTSTLPNYGPRPPRGFQLSAGSERSKMCAH